MIQADENKVMDFWADDQPDTVHQTDTYKILIADDDDEVHQITKLIFKGFDFEGKSLSFYSAYNGEETIRILDDNPDTAVIFLDVVMETEQSGLDVVRKVRDDLGNRLTRIILRTGQPGQAPEEKVIRDYDINDYRLKTEMTAIRLKTSLYAALRSYRDMYNLELHKKGLEQIIEASAHMFEQHSMNDFLVSILKELSYFQKLPHDLVYIREHPVHQDGFIAVEEESTNRIVAATGKYRNYIGEDIAYIPDFREVTEWVRDHDASESMLHEVEKGFIIQNRGNSPQQNFVYVEGDKENLDFSMIQLFLSNYAVALDNYILSNMLNETERGILIALGETIECHFQETGSHIQRIAEMMHTFAGICGYSYSDCEMLKIACTMHDLGKVAIPDAILKKPGRLDSSEFSIMKTHAAYGHQIMKDSNLPILKLASEIALNHHERWNGGGYPAGIKGNTIPKCARMLAILDVFDAMTHKRVYKDAMTVDATIAEMLTQKGRHFDPELLDLFVQNLNQITEKSRTL